MRRTLKPKSGVGLAVCLCGEWGGRLGGGGAGVRGEVMERNLMSEVPAVSTGTLHSWSLYSLYSARIQSLIPIMLHTSSQTRQRH